MSKGVYKKRLNIMVACLFYSKLQKRQHGASAIFSQAEHLVYVFSFGVTHYRHTQICVAAFIVWYVDRMWHFIINTTLLT